MLFKLLKDKPLIGAVPLIEGFFGNKYDRIEVQEATQFYGTEEAQNTTGWQRLRNLFRQHEDEVVHPAVTQLLQNSFGSFCIGGIYGAATASRSAFIDFIERNEATQFRSHLDAKRKLSDKMFQSYLKGFGKWGTKVSIFCTTFTATHLILSVYQNRFAFWHYTTGGAAAGALYKFQLGPKGMIAGAFFGGCFGTLYGCIKVVMLKLTNQTESDLLNFRNELKIVKDDYVKTVNKKNDSEQIQEELKQAMLNPNAPVVT